MIRVFSFHKKKDMKLIASNNAVVIMIPSFGVSSSQATEKEGRERSEGFDPAFCFTELRTTLRDTQSRRGKIMALYLLFISVGSR